MPQNDTQDSVSYRGDYYFHYPNDTLRRRLSHFLIRWVVCLLFGHEWGHYPEPGERVCRNCCRIGRYDDG